MAAAIRLSQQHSCSFDCVLRHIGCTRRSASKLPAAAHFALEWTVIIGDWSTPMWVSWIALVVAGGLAFLGLRLSQREWRGIPPSFCYLSIFALIIAIRRSVTGSSLAGDSSVMGSRLGLGSSASSGVYSSLDTRGAWIVVLSRPVPANRCS